MGGKKMEKEAILANFIQMALTVEHTLFPFKDYQKRIL